MFGKDCDMFYKRVKYDSFVELVKIKRGTKKYKIPVSLKYNGSDLCGDVEVYISAGNSDVRNEFLKVAAETLKYF
jgi:hypothetical protein